MAPEIAVLPADHWYVKAGAGDQDPVVAVSTPPTATVPVMVGDDATAKALAAGAATTAALAALVFDADV